MDARRLGPCGARSRAAGGRGGERRRSRQRDAGGAVAARPRLCAVAPGRFARGPARRTVVEYKRSLRSRRISTTPARRRSPTSSPRRRRCSPRRRRSTQRRRGRRTSMPSRCSWAVLPPGSRSLMPLLRPASLRSGQPAVHAVGTAARRRGRRTDHAAAERCTSASRLPPIIPTSRFPGCSAIPATRSPPRSDRQPGLESYGLSLAQPLFNGGLTAAQVEAARPTYNFAVATYRQTVYRNPAGRGQSRGFPHQTREIKIWTEAVRVARRRCRSH